MKKLIPALAALICLLSVSCKSTHKAAGTATKKEKAELETILAELRSNISDIDVSYLDGNVKIILAEAVYFKTGSAELGPQAADKLDKIAAIINKYPKTLLDLSGYTDNVGTRESNLTLSMNRSVSVKNYLQSRGVADKRMRTFGNGESNPVAANDTQAGRRQNRRVEFLIHY